MKDRKVSAIVYFEKEGRQNLPQVLNTLKRAFGKREDIRACKLVIFTAAGEGPALAYNKLKQYRPKIIAVTFPPGFSVKRVDSEGKEMRVFVSISEQLRKVFAGVDITILSSRLPFDGFDGVDSIKEPMKIIKDVLALFGGGFSLGVQAVLLACDMGAIGVGEKVIVITGDCAALVTASNTAKFLSAEGGLSINEILCKPRNLSLTRKLPKQPVESTAELFAVENEIKLLPPL